jgi:uncharacterized protein involved in exopolysaccharide biosynthesis
MHEVVGTPSPDRPDDAFVEQLDLVKYLLVLWRRRWHVLAVGLLCGVSALVVGFLMPPVYESSVKLVVSPPKASQVGEVPPPVSIATFRALVEGQSLAEKVVHEFKLDGPPFDLTTEEFLKDHLEVVTPRDSNVVVLTVSLRSADISARVANRLADLAIELSQRISQEETVRLRDSIAALLEQSKERLDRAQADLAAYRKQAQIEALRRDVDAQLGQRANILGLLLEIQAEKARLAQAEAQLARRERIGTLKRSIDGDPTLMEASRSESAGRSSVLGLQLKNEFLDGVYQDLEATIAQTRTKLSGLEKQRAELIDVRKLDASQLAVLDTLYAREAELVKRQTEYDVSRGVYLEVATRHEQVRLQVTGRSPQLQLMDPARPADKKSGPKIVRNAALAVFLGLIFAAVAAVLREALATAAASIRELEKGGGR